MMHYHYCSPSTSRAEKKYLVNYILPGIVILSGALYPDLKIVVWRRERITAWISGRRLSLPLKPRVLV